LTIHRAYQAALNHLNPDALAIAGWVGADALSCLDWARGHQRIALLMSGAVAPGPGGAAAASGRGWGALASGVPWSGVTQEDQPRLRRG
jgi:hypothetical protein